MSRDSVGDRECIAALRRARRLLGRWPTGGEYMRLRSAGRIHGPDARTVLARLGGWWPDVLVAAGGNAPGP